MAGAATRTASAFLALAIVGAAVWFARPTDVAPPPFEPASTTQAAPTKRVRHDDSSPSHGATDHVIAGRVTGLATGVTAHVEARRTGDCPARERDDDAVVWFDAPPVAAPADVAAAAGPDGAFELTVSTSGTFLVTAATSDGRDLSRSVEVPDPAPRVDVELAAPVGTESVRGLVVRADGAPFRGWVELREDSESDSPPIRWAMASAEGRFEFAGLGATHGWVVAVVPDERVSTGRAFATPGSGDVVLTLGGGPTRRGSVVSDLDRSPIVGARIVARAETDDGQYAACETATDASGGFAVRGAKEFLVFADARGFASAVLRDEKGGADEIVIRLRGTGAVAGRVLRSSDGTPLAGAVVVAEAWGYDVVHRRLATSAADGTYRIDEIPSGRCDVHVLGGGWASVGLATWSHGGSDEKQDDPFAVDVPPNAVENLDLRVEPTGRVAGRVFGPTGDALRAVRLAFDPGDAERTGPRWRKPVVTWTAADGGFSFENLPTFTNGSVKAKEPRFPPARQGVRVQGGETLTVDLRFEAAQRLEVSVVAAATGAPVPKAAVDVCIVDEDSYSGTSCGGVTSSDGRCVFVDAPDGNLAVNVEAAGFLPATYGRAARATRDPADPWLWRVEVRLQPAFVVAGRVLHADGTPAVKFDVALKSPEDAPEDSRIDKSVVTDDAGAFRFEGLPAGTYELSDWWERENQSLATVVAGGPEVLIRLPDEAAGAAIELSFVGPDGAPVPTGRVEFNGLEGGGYGDNFKAGRLIVPAKYYSGGGAVISASMACDDARQPLPLGAAIFSVPAPLPASLEIRFPAERVASGRVVGPDGDGVAARLRVRFAERGFTDKIASVLSADDGAFEIHQLGDGAYRLEVEPPRDFVPPAPVEIHGGDKDLVVTLAASACGVVTVLDDDGKPVRGAVVEVRATKVEKKDDEDESKPLVHLVAGADGKARVSGIVPGTEVALSVTGPANRDDLAPWSASPWTPRDVEVRLVRRK